MVFDYTVYVISSVCLIDWEVYLNIRPKKKTKQKGYKKKEKKVLAQSEWEEANAYLTPPLTAHNALYVQYASTIYYFNIHTS